MKKFIIPILLTITATSQNTDVTWAANAFAEGMKMGAATIEEGTGIFFRELMGKETKTDKLKKAYYELKKQCEREKASIRRQYQLQNYSLQKSKSSYYHKYNKAMTELRRLKLKVSKMEKAMKECGCTMPREKKKLFIQVTEGNESKRKEK